MDQLTRAIAARQTTNPRTVLGFYAGALAIVDAACIGAATALAKTNTATYLVPWALGFGAAVTILVLAAVILINVLDPAKLMLGQITGTEYAEIHRLRLGDNLTGEQMQTIITPETSPSTSPQLGPAQQTKDQGG